MGALAFNSIESAKTEEAILGLRHPVDGVLHIDKIASAKVYCRDSLSAKRGADLPARLDSGIFISSRSRVHRQTRGLKGRR